jgi:peptidoglycan/xylan/chitin deacetylase (PgdA/CDA1 family)
MSSSQSKSLTFKELLFYFVKPLVPRRLQIFFRRQIIRQKRNRFAQVWPINENAGKVPADWSGWPEKKEFAFILQHDVDTQCGHDKCRKLMDLEEKFGMRSTFYFVPERYIVSYRLIEEIKKRGFGVGVHGLKHDGKLFLSYESFQRQARRINNYLRMWDTTGFSTPSMIRRLEWMHHLDIDYSTSTFDTDPFEPQPEPVNTIFPFIVNKTSPKRKFVEMPYTLPQDFTLFVLMQEKDASIWKKKISWIAKHGGMALLNSHPDYMNFDNRKCGREEYPLSLYKDFLCYVNTNYKDDFWHVLTSKIACFIKTNSVM